MNNSKNLCVHYLALAGIIAIGAVLRFWNLDLKPLWLDEVLTALLSLGRPYKDVPLEVVFPLSSLHQLFTLQPDVGWFEIAQGVATQSTHPPLFFCLMHQWLSWMQPIAQPLIWKLRAIPALLGVGAIASIYYLNRVAFSPNAGLMAAAFMAFSPFGVYLSQEARHYTLPILLITLALLGLIQIQQALYARQQLPSPILWLSWGIVNSIGCYVHYFFILAFLAQLLTLTGLMYWRRRMLPRGSFLAVMLVVVGVAVSYLPWLSVLLWSFARQETSWLPKPEHIAPIYQTVAGWVSMAIALPIENQSLWVQVPMVLLTMGFASWVARLAVRGLKQLLHQPSTHIETFTLLCFTLGVLLQFVAIIYLLSKDITVAPRYNFVYYPAMCALLGASLTRNQKSEIRSQKLEVRSQKSEVRSQKLEVRSQKFRSWLLLNRSSLIILLVGILSCVFVVSDLAFQKPYNPQQVAQNMYFEPATPMMVVMGYKDFQDVALGLSFALAIDKLQLGISNSSTGSLPSTTEAADISLAFFHKESDYELVWQKLSKLQTLSVPRLNLWVVAPGLKRRDYPQQLVAGQKTCTIDPSHYHRIGIPYQLYRC